MSTRNNQRDAATPTLAILYVFGAGISFSVLDASAKYLVVAGMDAPFIAWARFAVHALIALAMFRVWSNPAVFKVASLPLQLLRGAFVFGVTYLNFLSLQTLQLAEMVSIFFAAPLVITVAAGPLLGEWAGPRRWIAVVVGFLGVLIVTRPGLGDFKIGHFYAFFAMACYAMQSVMTRSMSATESPQSLMFFSALAPAVLMLPTLPYYASAPGSAILWLILVSLGFYGALSHWLLIKAYRIATASSLAPYPYLQIVWMTALGYLIFDQLPDIWTMSGAAVIILSGLYVIDLERRLRQSSARP